jgi:LysM repeat protein
MPQTLVYILLLFALLLPLLGAILLRVLGNRLTLAQLYVAAGGIFALALASVLLLARSDVPSLQIGSLSVLLPVTAPEDIGVALPADGLPTTDATLEEPTAGAAPTAAVVGTEPTSAPAAATAAPAPTAAPTEAPTAALEPTAVPTAAPTAAPTEAPTAAPEPTAAPTAAPTEAPAPTAAPPPPSTPRKYTVAAGDTLRSIAEKFNVSVTALLQANKLTPQQADSLRVGQELVIPAP